MILTSNTQVGFFKLREWTFNEQRRGPPKYRELQQLGKTSFELADAQVRVRTLDMGTTRFHGDGKQPWQLYVVPGRTEERALLEYIVGHAMSGLTGRRIKSYICFVRSEVPNLYYIKGVYSTVKATKDIGPVDLIATWEHKGGKRDLGFDPPDESTDLWGLGS